MDVVGVMAAYAAIGMDVVGVMAAYSAITPMDIIELLL